MEHLSLQSQQSGIHVLVTRVMEFHVLDQGLHIAVFFQVRRTCTTNFIVAWFSDLIIVYCCTSPDGHQTMKKSTALHITTGHSEWFHEIQLCWWMKPSHRCYVWSILPTLELLPLNLSTCVTSWGGATPTQAKWIITFIDRLHLPTWLNLIKPQNFISFKITRYTADLRRGYLAHVQLWSPMYIMMIQKEQAEPGT